MVLEIISPQQGRGWGFLLVKNYTVTSGNVLICWTGMFIWDDGRGLLERFSRFMVF